MTPKEKAKELYLKMLKYQHQSNVYIERNIICPTAKNCALEAVDEMTKYIPNIYHNDMYKEKYWKQVKKEIRKL